MAAGMLPRILAALTSVWDAWNSASAWITLARRSRSASACLAMARTMFSVSSTVRISTLLTLMPQVGLSVQNALHVGAELLALGKHFVEFVLAEHGAQRRLGQHVRRRQIVLDLDDRAFGIDDVEIEHRVDFHRNIVAGDDVLAGDFNDLNAQVYPHHLLNEGRQQNKAGALHPLKAAQGEDDGALVFAQDAHRGHQADGEPQKGRRRRERLQWKT